jgi:hypothetical protein
MGPFLICNGRLISKSELKGPPLLPASWQWCPKFQRGYANLAIDASIRNPLYGFRAPFKACIAV